MGCVSGLGADKASTWQALIAGTSGIRTIKKFAEGQDELCFEGVGAAVPAGAEAGLRGHFDEKQLSGVDPFSSLAAIATLEALQQAGLWGDKPRLSRGRDRLRQRQRRQSRARGGLPAAVLFAAAERASDDHPALHEQRRRSRIFRCCSAFAAILSCSIERLFILRPCDRRSHAPDPRGARLGGDNGRKRCQSHLRLAPGLEGFAGHGARRLPALLHRPQRAWCSARARRP